jgi:hypothetical protein
VQSSDDGDTAEHFLEKQHRSKINGKKNSFKQNKQITEAGNTDKLSSQKDE